MTAVAVLMDPIAAIHVEKDSTLALLLEAQRRGHDLLYMTQGDLALREAVPFARLAPLRVRDDAEHWFDLMVHTRRRKRIKLSYRLDCLAIRLSFKGSPSCRHFIDDDSQTEDIALAVHRFASRLLRRHIVDGAHYRSGRGLGR